MCLLKCHSAQGKILRGEEGGVRDLEIPEAKSKVPDWGIKSTLAYCRVEVDSGIGLPMVNMLESTLEGT
jgi:hypothetical protein